MKRIIAAILILLLALSLCACKEKGTEQEKKPSTGSDLTWEEIMEIAERELEEETESAENSAEPET